MRAQKASDGACISVMRLHAHAERLEPAVHEKRCMGVNHAAQHAVQLSHLRHQVAAPGQRATQHVVMASQVLGARVQHKIGAKLDGSQVDGRRKRGVKHRDDAVAAAQAHNLRHVHHADHGRAEIGRVEHGAADAHLGQHRVDKLSRTTVAIGGDDHVPVLRHESQQHGGDSVHAARR
ncbi:Cystathionine gamma-synthase Rhodoplastic CGS1 [Gracilaria domingensis]|nr:Cystathionine gamma-synthase Rhodoplastic CGS1 [Gracilaria domingensis]